MYSPQILTPTVSATWGREGKTFEATQQKPKGRLSEQHGKSSGAGGRPSGKVLGAWGPPLSLTPCEGEPCMVQGQGEGQHPGSSTMAGMEALGHSLGHVCRGGGCGTASFVAQLPGSCLKHPGKR